MSLSQHIPTESSEKVDEYGTHEKQLTHEVLEVDDWTAEDEVLAKRGLRRVDLSVIVTFAVNRSNIGNANLTGFSTDLGLVGNQYGAAVSVVYSTYVFFEPTASVLVKIVTPKVMITFCTLAWAVITIGSAFIKNYDQLLAVRILLGIFEAGMIPTINLFLSMTYNRDEYVTRQIFIYFANCMSGAFGGLLAYGLSQIHASGLHGWQWMYLVEGLISICLVPLAWFMIPNEATQCRFLKPAERAAMEKRRIRNRRIYDERDKFTWGALLAAVKDFRVYFMCISQFGMLCTVYSLTTFMPSIVAGLGFTTRVQAQLLTVPVYVIAAVGFAIAGFFSDRYKIRSPFILASNICNLIGFIMLAASDRVGVRYAGCFIGCIGLYAGGTLNNMWCADNFGPHYKRALSMGMMQFIGNTAGAIIGFIFTTQTAPRYLKGLHFDVGMTCVSFLCTCTNALYARHMNKKKREMIAAGAPDDPSLGDKNPHYLWFM
ncbi:hypothetical protein TREMEDRAFT_68492 [Tremella mesenterica DSM 1558]|uniref:uncharacterized protein n=1 Tax=Tremella mesenterica (strain ATCC 24925 / CBS 8224 / DSM 1558 / NBRC 9311 / NRRL Y-6157 / RJB 2259-6 / UBC 559-6) TaxID=578456 RepID=UPI0003F49563|nr:uncharacterized protein TREMEDRAFT_68492 [Tremella mesenterica DSM 1558]EIW70115.1 hypothetical protein TREMEDRAFT_68492 [Tremella mesenterica DSM 1558]